MRSATMSYLIALSTLLAPQAVAQRAPEPAEVWRVTLPEQLRSRVNQAVILPGTTEVIVTSPEGLWRTDSAGEVAPIAWFASLDAREELGLSPLLNANASRVGVLKHDRHALAGFELFDMQGDAIATVPDTQTFYYRIAPDGRSFVGIDAGGEHVPAKASRFVYHLFDQAGRRIWGGSSRLIAKKTSIRSRCGGETGSMISSLVIAWRCRDGVALTPRADGIVSLTVDGDRRIDLRMASPKVRDALLRLGCGADEGSLLGTLRGDDHSVALLLYYLERLRRYGLLVAEVWRKDQLLLTLAPRSRHFDVALPCPTEGAWQLSRFAYLRRDGEDLVLECPEAPAVGYVRNQQVVAWLHEASRPTTPEAGTPRAQLLALLGSLGFLVDPASGESDAQWTWEFHDRLFHSRARQYDDFRPHGGTYRFRDWLPSPPAIRPAHAGETVHLATPERRAGRPLLEVMDERRSRREMGSRPVSRAQAAELLYRVARVREVLPSPLQDCLLRPYPSGGAIHELEFYLAVDVCQGLSSGFYHYRGTDHALTRLEGGAGPAQEMLADAASAWGQPGEPPQCLIVLASRLSRLAWKYEAIAYKISLMNAGVVLQSLYLVCTELGLNGSAVGSGRPDLFAAATNASSWEETSIAEFGFGTRPD